MTMKRFKPALRSGTLKTTAKLLKEVSGYWRSILLVLAPIVLSPLPLTYRTTDQWRAMNCAYTVMVMATYWIFELLPIPITALMPVFMFPLLGVLSTKDTATPYFSASNFLFFGGLIIAISVEEVNLHKRLALRVLLLMGSDPKWIMFGFMFTAWFLSMWMSNTATTAMMLPIAMAVIEELIKYQRKGRRFSGASAARRFSGASASRRPSGASAARRFSDGSDEPIMIDYSIEPHFKLSIGKHEKDHPIQDKNTWSKEETKLAKAILLCLCYSANIGGTGTLTGTVPNVIALGQLQKSGIKGVTYANWMALQIPAAAVFLVLTWLWLMVYFFPIRNLFQCQGTKGGSLTATLRGRYRELGPMKFGWGSFFKDGYVADAVPAVLIAVALFALPRDAPDFMCFRSYHPLVKAKHPQVRKALMTWDSMKKFPWDVILILGGGFSMAAGVKESELSVLVANALRDNLADRISPSAFGFVVIALVTFITELTSNSSTANIFIPILISVAQGLGVHPFYYAVPVAIACSLAFMIPVATPPNAIVFGAGILKIRDMMVVGFVLNWIGIGMTTFCANFYMPYILDMSQAVSGTTNLTAGVVNVTAVP